MAKSEKKSKKMIVKFPIAPFPISLFAFRFSPFAFRFSLFAFRFSLFRITN